MMNSPPIRFEDMTAYINIGKFWSDDLTIERARQMSGLDRRTLSQSKKGQLERCQVDTLLRLKKFVSELAERDVAIEEIISSDGVEP